MSHVSRSKNIKGKTQPVRLYPKPQCKDENKVTCRVTVEFSNIPLHRYEDFCDEVQAFAREELVEVHLGVGEND